MKKNFKPTARMYHARVYFKLKREADVVRNELKMRNRDADSHVIYNPKLELHGVEIIAPSRPLVVKSINILNETGWASKPQVAKLIKQVKPVPVTIKKIRKKPFKGVKTVKKFIKVRR